MFLTFYTAQRPRAGYPAIVQSIEPSLDPAGFNPGDAFGGGLHRPQNTTPGASLSVVRFGDSTSHPRRKASPTDAFRPDYRPKQGDRCATVASPRRERAGPLDCCDSRPLGKSFARLVRRQGFTVSHTFPLLGFRGIKRFPPTGYPPIYSTTHHHSLTCNP